MPQGFGEGHIPAGTLLCAFLGYWADQYIGNAQRRVSEAIRNSLQSAARGHCRKSWDLIRETRGPLMRLYAYRACSQQISSHIVLKKHSRRLAMKPPTIPRAHSFLDCLRMAQHTCICQNKSCQVGCHAPFCELIKSNCLQTQCNSFDYFSDYT